MRVKFRNQFNTFQQDFKNETGLEANERVDLYIQYVNVRLGDEIFQMQANVMAQLITILEIMAGKVAQKRR